MFTLDEIAIVHHTDCGTLHFTNEGLSEKVKGTVDKARWADIEKIDFGANKDIKESVKDDLDWLRENPLIREELKKGCKGFVLDIKTGKVAEV
ncbi:hypothetical protein H2198_005081 [Neophaeococcomyces mojaviensis]|uniref:Uncharacterized protein n=1 Tax=Neophaeococcomyces mojaviensis TaxID=3383035 RepID=A0ACC3A6S0_9EURO|nr:hypothetical protein H2198_005081 [Knufia sp. JES_112]